MLLTVLLAAATGFFHVEQASDGRWDMIDPQGRTTFLCGINTVNYAGPWCAALNTHPYKDENRKRFPSEAAWADDAVARMRKWGFNCLGAHSSTSTWTVCEIPHVKILLMGQKFSCLPGKDHCLFPYEGRPTSAFPNVWHPDFEKWCDDFAAANCAREKGDPKLVGYYIDNELKWKGLADLRPGEKDFLRRTAERYFTVTTAAIRKADPNHMILGCRFAGMSGAPKEVYAEAGKRCDVVSFNNYPFAHIDRNLVSIYTGYRVLPAAEAFLEASTWAGGRPLIVSEWSFPALDSGLPCTKGAGQRFMTQNQRAVASELYARTMMAAPQVVGYSYFKWTDQPAFGKTHAFGENSNYGVLTIKGDVYQVLTDMFSRLQPDRMRWRHTPPPEIKPPPPPDPKETVMDFLSKSNATIAAGASVRYQLTDGRFRIVNSAGLRLEGRLGGPNVLDRIALGDDTFGTWNVMLCTAHENGRKSWTRATCVSSADFEQTATGGILHVRARNAKSEPAFEFGVDLHVFPDRAAFVANVVSVTNIGKKAFTGDRVFMRPEPAFAPATNAIVPALWRPLTSGGWTSARDGRRYEAHTGSGLLVKMEFPVGKDGNASPEMAFRPIGDFTLEPGSGRSFDGTVWGEFSVSRPRPKPDRSAVQAPGAKLSPCTSGVYNVRDFGAKGDGATKDTAAIQAAIDAANSAGGGEVRVPAGRYVSGSIFLKSNVDLNICAGAVVVGSKDPSDYNKWDVCPQNNRSIAENHEGGHLFLCIEQTNVTVRGAGTIDGSGSHFMTYGYDKSRVGKRTGRNGLGRTNPQDAILWRPAQMLWFCESDHIRLEGLKIFNAPYWSVLFHGCTYVEARGLHIWTSRENPLIHNGDGLNIDCCRHVRVSDCDIETSDDSLCLRANGKSLLHSPSETAYVTVANCTLSSRCEAFRIGVGEGPIHDCTIANCVIRDSRRGINFSSTWFPGKGCDFENIRFDNIISHTSTSFLKIHRLKSRDPVIRNLHFSNISGTQGEPSYIWSRKGKPFENISLINVDMNGGIEVVNVNGFRLEGGTLKEIVLSPEEYEQRSKDIESFKKLLY